MSSLNLSRFYKKQEKKNRERLSRLVSGSSSTSRVSPAAGPASDDFAAGSAVNEPAIASSSNEPATLGKRKRGTEILEKNKKNKGKEVVREVIELSSDGNVRKISKLFEKFQNKT